MYSTGTVTTTANSTKLVGTGTKWLNNINRVSAEQAIQIQIDNTVYNNSIQSIQSDTELTLNFPLPTAATGAKYVILTTMVHSVSDAMNKIVSMNGANVQFSDILTRWMTEQGIITVTLPDQTTQQLRTTKEMDKQLDGKASLASSGSQIFKKEVRNEEAIGVWSNDAKQAMMLSLARETPDIYYRINGVTYYIKLPSGNGTLMREGDFGFGGSGDSISLDAQGMIDYYKNKDRVSHVFRNVAQESPYHFTYGATAFFKAGDTYTTISADYTGKGVRAIGGNNNKFFDYNLWTDRNTTKDSNGNLKAASPVVKLFADDIELNDESEGVEMEHLGIGHYLIKGVVGFNADGAWGINNGFVIPQDHNGKNMVLIDYEVRPDGDIEVFVFHQQNADMPERFQNKRIKHFDEEGVPVYFENYEPCDVPESRWIDMRVEMPLNSLYNQKQAEAERLAKLEAERLAKLEAERLAQEEAKRAVEEVERVEQ
ncbi:cell envelope integrity protein TolA [Providencia rettgeri]|uniref:cell envelope integrity protein TolA n=1 Tax=Providencia rettgeri TaxID=587 RepID=UPI001EE70BA1|nr:cell envelope integrity protein TolA [Providencia rettgeri]MCG5368655.1 cell envelope integrity protein TolA [Providencia rettgeri]